MILSSIFDPYPLLLDPVYKDYIWGGQSIVQKYFRAVDHQLVAESWELSSRPEGVNAILNGKYQGYFLSQLIEAFPYEILGKSDCSNIPILNKIIDATQTLSIQVHPCNHKSLVYGGEPKSEAWIVLDAKPGSVIYAGFNQNVSSQLLLQAITTKQVEKLLNRIEVQVGDVIFIPGGMVHAIGKGCLIYEIQQNSNTTYRIYDWGRVDKAGHPRDLHIDQALQIMNFNKSSSPLIKPVLQVEEENYSEWKLLDTSYFSVDKLLIFSPITYQCKSASFTVLFLMEGTCLIRVNGGEIKISSGNTCLIPAQLKQFEIIPEGPATLLATFIR